MPRTSLAGRAVVALALLIGFYLLAVLIAVTAIALPVLEYQLLHRLTGYLVLAPLLGLSILWSLVPRRTGWTDPGPEFTAADQPELTAMIGQVAAAIGQPMPAQTFFLDEVNAFVTTRGGLLGFGGRRVLAVGVPLLVLLDPDELAAVLAHEFGHFSGGDTRLGPLIYRTRGALERTLSVSSGGVRAVFRGYAAFYLRRTQAISRAQEYAADRLAVAATSAPVAAAALSRLVIGSPAYDFYRRAEYLPILRAGRRPPYLPGFAGTLASSTVTERAETVALGVERLSAFDSHPPIPDRIRALGIDPARIGYRPVPAFPALRLVRDPAAVEAALVVRQLTVDPAGLAPISWPATGPEIVLPQWRQDVLARLRPAAPQLDPADVPTDPDQLAALGAAIAARAGRSATRPEREETARVLCQRLLGVAAVEAGWQPVSLPGEPVRFVRAGAGPAGAGPGATDRLDVVEEYARVCAGRADPVGWRQRVLAAGLAGRVRVPAAAAVPVGPGDPRVAGVAAGHAALVGSAAGGPVPGMPGWPVGGGPGDGGSSDGGPGDGGPGGGGTDGTVEPPMRLRVTPAPLGRRELIIDGTRLSWGSQTVDAGQVTEVGYAAVRGMVTAVFTTPSGRLVFRVRTNRAGRRLTDAWTALVRWSERYVEPRLVDGLLEQLHRNGWVRCDGVNFTWDGVQTHRGTVGWDDFAGTRFTGSEIVLLRTADTLDGHAKFGAVRTLEPGGAVVPQLCAAIIASRRRPA
jgi:Zn-dependent protease with chaperone function